jgi:predicted nuclease of predicted toxin-antitoxin system
VKILIDEDLPHKLRDHLPGDVYTIAFMGWGGLKNGELLKAAEHAGFDVLVTGDQSMPDEQNLSVRKLAIVTLSAIEWPFGQIIHAA